MRRIYRNTSEIDLINLIKGNNKREADNALLEIIARNESSLKFFIMRRIYDTQEREDIYNEALVRLWKKIDGFDPAKGKISTWLFTITNNLIIDSIRRKKEGTVYLEELTSNSEDSERLNTFEVPDNSHLASKCIEDKQRNQIVRAALDKTFSSGDPRRMVFELRFISELTYDEIVQLTNFSLGSVKAWLHRSRNEFEKQLKKEVGKELVTLLEE